MICPGLAFAAATMSSPDDKVSGHPSAAVAADLSDAVRRLAPLSSSHAAAAIPAHTTSATGTQVSLAFSIVPPLYMVILPRRARVRPLSMVVTVDGALSESPVARVTP